MHLLISIPSQRGPFTLTVGPFSDQAAANQQLSKLTKPSKTVFDSLARVGATGMIVEGTPLCGCDFHAEVDAEAIVVGCRISHAEDVSGAGGDRQFERLLLIQAQAAYREELSRRSR